MIFVKLCKEGKHLWPYRFKLDVTCGNDKQSKCSKCFKNSCVIQWNPGNISSPFILFDSVVSNGLQIGDKPKKLSS